MATNKLKDIEERGDSEASIIADGMGLGMIQTDIDMRE
jgi:hypothetical protein